MLNKLKEIKITLMKQRHDVKERLNNPTPSAEQTDATLQHELTLQINGINTVLTEMKNFAVKNKLANESKLIIDDQVKVLNLVLKQLDKEAEAYTSDHPKAKDAIFTKEYLQTFIPAEFLPATTDEMDAFVKETKEQGLAFKDIMQQAKTHKNFDMKYISQAARN